jgi:hypothetical protein
MKNRILKKDKKEEKIKVQGAWGARQPVLDQLALLDLDG